MARSVPQSLLIPVETLNREFDAKLLLALKAAGRGYRPIIGGRTLIHQQLPKLPASIYLAKGIRTGNRLMMSILDSLGHVIVALDEEALVRTSDEALHLMFDEETFNRPRLLYAWGRSNADVWRSYKGYRGTPILETGNPRVDLLRPELRSFFDEDVRALRERFGPYVMFSSNFALVNHFIPDHVRFRVAADASKERTAELKGGLRGHKQAIFDRFRTLIPALAEAIAPTSLVIRPHPSENAGIWKDIAATSPNMHVVHEGPIAPWLMAASALVHNGCTSAVEASVVGTPAFAYQPVVDATFDSKFPNSVSMSFSEDAALIAAVEEVLAHGRKGGLTPDRKAILDHNIASIEGDLACDRILQSLEDRRHVLEAHNLPSAGERVSGRVRHFLRGIARAARERHKAGRSSGIYTAHKFPGISEPEVNARITRLRRALPDLPDIRASERLPNIFEVR